LRSEHPHTFVEKVPLHPPPPLENAIKINLERFLLTMYALRMGGGGGGRGGGFEPLIKCDVLAMRRGGRVMIELCLKYDKLKPNS
jgi:hypothetical protein